ncbi:MAG: AMP-binding protein [Treponema sp.]|nr:AMP-binding protein [Treponema sp.]MCL2237602.1 AMP-binding protein [Treponema sp.]
MPVPYTEKPWEFLNEYRGKIFTGQWPTLPEMFRITVSRFPERACFTIYEPDRISINYTEALYLVESVARWLHGKGIRRGDRVAVTGKNSPEWAIAYLGTVFAGGVVVPIDYQLKNEESDLLIKTAGARILFVDEEKLDHYNENSCGLESVISLKQGLGTYIYTLNGPEAEIDKAIETDIAAILFTSGTTGVPKGVMLTHKNLVSDCYQAQGTPLIILHTDVFYAILPIHHSYTMLAVFIETISVGAEVVFGKKMVTTQILKDLKEAQVTMLLGVPMLFNKVLTGIRRGLKAKGALVFGIITFLMGISGIIKKVFKVNPGKKMFKTVLDKASLSSVRICISGGGPLAPSVFRKYNQLGIDFVQGYGLTETSPIITINPVEQYKETSVGRTCPGVDMKILNPDERGIGEVIVKGSMVMLGYFNMPEETAATFTPDGYLKTGDLGYMDSENYLYLTGRAKNMIVTEGGKNVYPEEIENEFQLFEEIDQILIRGFVLDQKLKTEGIEALVHPNPEYKNEKGNAISKDEMKAKIENIIHEVNQTLQPYQKINKVEILDKPMEMTTTKKIKRGNL